MSNNPFSSKTSHNKSSNQKSSRSLISSDTTNHSNSLASTPYSIVDPSDELWTEFLNSLYEPSPLNQTNHNFDSSLLTNQISEQNQLNENNESRIDNDDAADDPDFTVCLDNCDLDDPDMDDWFQIPKKEAVELVKDAIEICDGAPIVFDDQRHSKLKSAITIKKLSNELNAKTSENENIQEQIQKNLNDKDIDKSVLVSSSSSITITKLTNDNSSRPCESDKTLLLNYVPVFTDLERKQLDEQLRNHVQLLTQSCLICYCSREFKYVYEEAFSLLNVLSSLGKIDTNVQKISDKENDLNDRELLEQEENINNINKTSGVLLSSDFKIINLNESLEILNNIKQMDKEQLNFDQKQGIPTKFLEIIVTSPVFYNTNLIPNLSKFKYQSHFKRSQFSETEKILLIMGFNKFKHLPKNECCECIKEHLLPQRSCDDIRKQLNYFSNSEQRQNQLKELLKKQKKLNTNSLFNYEFNIEIHYKSPYEQSENVHLPSQYTIIIERLRLAKVLKDTRKTLKEIKEKNIPTSSTPSKSTSSTLTLPSSLNQISNEQIEKSPLIEAISTRKEKEVFYIKINKEQKIRPPITKIASHNKRGRSESPTSLENDLNDLTTSISVHEDPVSSPPRSQSPIVLSSASPSPEKKNSQNHTFINQTINSNKMSKLIINPQRVIPISNMPLQPLTLTGLPQSTIILPSTNFYDLFTKPGNILNPTILNNIQTIPQVIQQPSVQQFRNNYAQPQSQPPVILPSNFSGTVLVQPTIHIHMDKKSLNMAKYCQIRPKQPGSSSTTNSTANSSNLINKSNNNSNKKQKN